MLKLLLEVLIFFGNLRYGVLFVGWNLSTVGPRGCVSSGQRGVVITIPCLFGKASEVLTLNGVTIRNASLLGSFERQYSVKKIAATRAS